uniref:RRM domain-containing protein n=1 Tax=Lactuca sativa TaxID=4236 RepID=A0A9R1VEN7_LACSA|nr:hypothetical protein LSAT_V11C500284920 [Lactuca sativa]
MDNNIGVTNEDIRLNRYAIHFDKSGCPNGTGEVMFARRSDAFKASKHYNNVQLDGKPMKIEIVGSKSDVPLSPCVNLVRRVLSNLRCPYSSVKATLHTFTSGSSIGIAYATSQGHGEDYQVSLRAIASNSSNKTYVDISSLNI